MRRFLIEAHLLASDPVIVTGGLFHHMAVVLRVQKGARVALFDGAGNEARGVVGTVDKETLLVHIEERLTLAASRDFPRIVLLQAVAKGEKMDYLLQKTTELGVDEIVPFVSSRTVAKVQEEKRGEKQARWERIIEQAAQQSRSPLIPKLHPAVDFRKAIEVASGTRLMLWEGEQQNGLRDILESVGRPDRVTVMVGPEGGFSSQEADAAAVCGFMPTSLGRRILRCETAGVAAVAILKFWWGELG